MPPSVPWRVLFLNDLGFQYGAGIAQARQIQSLLDAGREVAVIAWEPGGIEFEHVTTKPMNSDLWRGLIKVRHLETSASMSDDEVIAGLLLQVARFAPEVVVVGNLHGAHWSLRLLPALREVGCRVIAYLHDGYLFSGRCAYPGTCTLYLTGCNETCPTAHEYPVLAPKLIAEQWNLRRQIFNGPNGMEVVANSHWTRDVFRTALPLCRSCETVYLAADENIFKPGDKNAARRQLRLRLDRPIVLCAAVNFQDRRKGGHFLSEIIGALQESVTFAAFGHNAAEIPGLIGLGYHTNAPTLALIYQAADVFLGTAIEEAFGQTVMEAQLCGLPVVAFQAGGVNEIVRNEITGKLVRIGDSAGAVAAINSLLGNVGFRATAGAWARESARNRFGLGAQAKGWGNYLAGIIPHGTGLNPPTITYGEDANDVNLPHRPSWPAEHGFVSAEHPDIFALTAQLPGWQMPGDSFKLYEMGFHAGDVILEIGTFGGRSATIELRGALANPARELPPQYYGIDTSANSIIRTRQILADNNLVDYCHLFQGNLEDFVSQWSIEPTMVFLDGDHHREGVAADMAVLSRYLKPGVPVLVHDYSNPETDTGENGVHRAALEWAATGRVRFIGCFGCSALYVTPSIPA